MINEDTQVRECRSSSSIENEESITMIDDDVVAIKNKSFAADTKCDGEVMMTKLLHQGGQQAPDVENRLHIMEDGEKDSNCEKSSKDELARGTWNSQLDFTMSCIAYAVGLGNVWRFPYLSFKNGGGAFLVPYFIALITCGIPLFLLEVTLGQYLGVGGTRVIGQLCPIFKGVGYAAMMMVFLENVYYIVIVAWTLFYILNTFYSLAWTSSESWEGGLPWQHCPRGNSSWASERCFDIHKQFFNESDAFLKYNIPNESMTITPVETFWDNAVLRKSTGIDEIGGVHWELFAYLVVGWLGVYLVVCKGLHSSGKIIWFSALFPYVILTILVGKAVTLSGAWSGIKFFFTPDWSRLATAECWIDGGTQIFYSYGVGIGALFALGSYNKFNHNCYRDTFVVCTVNTFTSFYASIVIFAILGFMAETKGVEIKDVVQSGPGLAFLVYPEAVLQLYPSTFWAILFFLMLLVLGFDSQFCILEALVVGFIDNWPKVLRPRRALFTAALVLFMLLLDIPLIMNGGVYIFQLMDFYSASGMSLLWAVFFQTIAISYCFGADKVYACMEQMTGLRISRIWLWCWKIISPAFMMFLFVFYFIKYEPIKYGKTYEYPVWGEVLGFLISISSMIWIPTYAFYYVCTQREPGESWLQVLKRGMKPKIKMRADATPAAS